MLRYEKGSARMMTPKAVLRVAELLETPEIAALNRAAGFGDPAGRKPPLGRWPRRPRSGSPTARRTCRCSRAWSRPATRRRSRSSRARAATSRAPSGSSRSSAGSRSRPTAATGGSASTVWSVRRRERFDGLSEAEICERIVAERCRTRRSSAGCRPGSGLTPAIMVALLPSLSDRDLRMLTPTLEELGLLADEEIRRRWERAIAYRHRPAGAQHRQERVEPGAAREARRRRPRRRCERRSRRPSPTRTCTSCSSSTSRARCRARSRSRRRR